MIGNGQKHHGVTVLGAGLVLVAHLPVVFKLRGVVGRIVAVEIVHRDHGDLRAGRRVIELQTEGVKPSDGLRRKHVGEVAHVVGGLRQVSHLFGMRGNREKCEKRRQQGRNQGETCAARASHFSFIVRGRGGRGSRRAGSTLEEK